MKTWSYILCFLAVFGGGAFLPVFAEIHIFACEPEWKSLAEEIGGEKVEVYSATTAFQDPHHIEARPSLIAKMRKADLVFCAGADLEIGWLPLLLRQSGNAKIQQGQKGYLLATSLVDLIEVAASSDRSQGDVHAAGNPHIHWDPYRVLKVANGLSIRLGEIDPTHSLYYQERFIQFEKKWHQAMKTWHKEIQALRGKKAIVYHKNWNYLLHWLGVEVIGDLEPKPGIPPTSHHLATLLQLSHQHRPDFIMVTNYQDTQGAQWLSERWLSEKIAVPVIQLPYTVGGTEKATDLISLYSAVLSALSNHSLRSNPHAQ